MTTVYKGFQCDEDGNFLYEIKVFGDPIDDEPMTPRFATLIAPLKKKSGFIRRFNENKQNWEYIESHVGETAYNKETKEAYEIKEYGPIPSEFTVLKPNEMSKWDETQGKWVTDDELKTKILEQIKVRNISAIDDLVGEIYLHFTRFDKEYQRREQQAKEFKANGYNGEVPLQVNAFAVNAGIPARQATDIILAQAAKLNQALDILGNLRMKKYQINKQETIEDVKAVTEQLMQEIQQVSEQL